MGIIVLEIIVVIAVLFLIWLIWQFIRAKRFTQFKRQIFRELKPKVIESIVVEMAETRDEQLPNAGRILQAALKREIIDEQWLKETGNLRNTQHLFHIERDKLHR